MSKSNANGDEFSCFFSEEEILCQTQLQDHDELLMEMLKRLAFTRGVGNVPTVYRSVQDREAAGATIVAEGIAIPHARIEGITRPLVAIATSERGIRFQHDAPLVRLVILLLVPKEQPAVYLQIIAALGRILENPQAADSAAQLKTPEELVKFFRRGGMVLPDYVCAADIMVAPGALLRTNHSLKDAIDLFVARDLLEIPVVDKDGELTGVVTAAALLRVCMPDYILWMDDLSPILQFEPFVSILRNEESTWLAEIISHDYAVVRVDDPAIAVAEAMARRNASVCYVIRGKTLAGVITLPHFLNKVLRD